ncbi:Mitochondrial import inner membrane translocase subunit Tim9 [Vitis vinifera]|uniref:Mitochondrial import inner membrane translocase subunit n=1 Tax=Vitis vinifera TaxID=29760 RepID=A0A438FAW3_VITVI|nr:Mitochondrial import inner membrane translocase subunit Tim9 [Vitis vinifera]
MDKSMLGDLDSLPEEDKLRMSVMIDQLQIRDSSALLSFIEKRFRWFHSPYTVLECIIHWWRECFSDCVESFRRKSLDKQEETCVRRCAEKFLKHSMRVGMRFAELNQGTATPD